MSIKQKVTKYIIENWIDSVYCIGYRRTEDNFWEETISRFNVLKPTFRYWYADPIPCTIKGKDYIFMEKYDRIAQRGHIAVAELKANGKITKPRTIVKRNTHMSFPMIISYKGQYYMIPESSETHHIDIYIMDSSVLHWKHYYSIHVNEEIVDIVFEIQGENIILLGGILNNKNILQVKKSIITIYNFDNINKFHYKLEYMDEEYSYDQRNAGNFFIMNGEKYLVTQESTQNDYGMYLKLYKVNEFNESNIQLNYIKRKTAQNLNISLSPYRYRKIGTHTYGRGANKYEVVDISATQLSIHPLLRRMRGK